MSARELEHYLRSSRRETILGVLVMMLGFIHLVDPLTGDQIVNWVASGFFVALGFFQIANQAWGAHELRKFGIDVPTPRLLSAVYRIASIVRLLRASVVASVSFIRFVSELQHDIHVLDYESLDARRERAISILEHLAAVVPAADREATLQTIADSIRKDARSSADLHRLFRKRAAGLLDTALRGRLDLEPRESSLTERAAMLVLGILVTLNLAFGLVKNVSDLLTWTWSVEGLVSAGITVIVVSAIGGWLSWRKFRQSE